MRRRLFSFPLRLGLWLAVLALAVRMLVPVGFMPAAGGPVALVACPDAGPIVHAMPGMMHHADHAPHADHRCPFGAVAGAVALLGAPILAGIVLPIALPRQIVLWTRPQPGPGLAAPPPPKTGPPFLR